jgi:putative hydrolase of the HAD superfamily
MLKAVIMDMDGTLYRQAPVRAMTARRLLWFAARSPRLGWKTVRGLRAYRRAQEILRRGAETAGNAWRQVDLAARMTGYTPDFIRRCVGRWMEVEPLSAVAAARYAGVVEFFEWACANGLLLAVVSDYDPREKLQVMGLRRYITAAVWAQETEVGVFKPDPRGLQVAVERLGIEPCQAVFIGDRPEVDGAAASAAGIPGILLSSNRTHAWPGASKAGDWYAIRKLVGARINL